MAKMINAYSVPLMALHDHGLNIKGIRKLECTYNPRTNTYNPHFHLLIEGKEAAKLLIDLWLKRYPEANIKGQDMRPADPNSLIELFKYTVKGVHKGKYFPEALDVIYQALEGRRTYQPFGIRKMAEEDIDGIRSEAVTFKGYRDDMWRWSKVAKDWVNDHGELLTDYIIEGKLSDWIEDLTSSVSEDLTEPTQEQTQIRVSKREFEDFKWQRYTDLTNEIFGIDTS